MTFSRKVFYSVFFVTLAIGATLIWASHSYVRDQTTENYLGRYTTFSKIMGDALSRLDSHTESVMLNAAKVVEAKDAEIGLPSTEILKDLRNDLNMTHIFVINKKGEFIRSTNEDPKLIPNVFSFCPDYRKLVDGSRKFDATPIIHPQPEPKPYKFLLLPTRNRERIIEVGVRVDFIASTLTEALESDSDLLSMSLYEPDGRPFGRFSSQNVEFNGAVMALPNALPMTLDDGKSLRFFTKVKSSHPICCQCDLSGTSRNGEYYYVLEAEVSKAGLAAVLAATRRTFLFLSIASMVLAFFLSRIFAKRLVRNIEDVAKKVQKMKLSRNLKDRINLDGKDEVSFLTNEFDRLLDTLEESQKKLVEAEKNQAKIQIAREVAHNIRSPALAIEMVLDSCLDISERFKRILRESSREIRVLAAKLSKESEKALPEKLENATHRPINIAGLVKDVVEEKRVEFAQNNGNTIEFVVGPDSEGYFVSVDQFECRAVLSNIINNAFESYKSEVRKIEVSCVWESKKVRIAVRDYGRGIPEEILGKIRLGASVTSKMGSGRGIGLSHAFSKISSWNGEIDIRSNWNSGTTVTITLPLAQVGFGLKVDFMNETDSVSGDFRNG